MKKQEKIFTVQNLTETLKGAKAVVLTDYRGLNVTQMTNLRQQVKKAGGQLMVVKNTLLKKAFENAKLPLPSEFTGPTAIAICLDDEIGPIKAIFDYAGQAGLPTFKSGVWEGKALEGKEIEKLGQLPGKDVLIRRLLGLLVSPSYSLVNVLSVNQKKLVYILAQKGRGGE